MTNHNAKGELIARLVSLGLGIPTFEALSAGPAHERTFNVTVAVGGQVLAEASGRSKKEAERLASERALLKLDGPTKAEGQTVSAPTSGVTSGAAWPIYAQVLAQSVEAALEFAEEDATLQDVQQEAAQFYRGLLAELGHQPEPLGRLAGGTESRTELNADLSAGPQAAARGAQ